jgi:hypothetical protein
MPATGAFAAIVLHRDSVALRAVIAVWRLQTPAATLLCLISAG